MDNEDLGPLLMEAMKKLGQVEIAEMGKTASKKINETIDACLEEINGYSKSNPLAYYQQVIAKLQNTVNTIYVLRTLKNASAVYQEAYGIGQDPNTGYVRDDIMRMIVCMCTK